MIATEQELIGVALAYPGVTTEQHVDGADFDDPRLGMIWDAVRALEQKHAQPTPATLTTENPNIDTSLIIECTGLGMPVNADRYGDEIRQAAFARTLDGALLRAHQQISEGVSAEEVLATIGQVRPPVDRHPESLDFLDFINQPIPPTEWIVPDLIGRGDRLILTGEEGVGKSQLLREIAVCASSGIHPFTGEAAPTRKVLYLDLENPQTIMIKTFQSIYRPLHVEGRPSMRVARFPDGLNLLATKDRLTLRQLVSDTRPDLLIGGPLYKMYLEQDGKSAEYLARGVSACLDSLREEFGFALALEHHAPHKHGGFANRDLRPIGSSLWLRWPEFGLGLAKADGYSPDNRIVKVVHWRGDRDMRPWPAFLQQGAVLPWIGTDHEGQSLRRAA